MRLTILLVAVAVALGAAPRPAAAQSLAEIAAKEKERRKGTGGKVITESDLGSASQTGSSLESETPSDADTDAGSPAEGAAASDKGGPKEKSEDEKRADRKAALQKEIDAERAHIEGIKKDIAVREVELNDTSNYLVGDARRNNLLKYVEDAKQAIATHEAQVEKLQEQARREGISVR